MSGKQSEKEGNVASISSAAEQRSSGLSPSKLVRNIPVGKPGPKCRKMLVDETNDEAAPIASEGETNKSDPGDVPGELQEMFGELASSPEKRISSPTAKVTTENLLSVLEDDAEKKPEQESSSKPVQPVPPKPAPVSTPTPTPPSEIPTLNGSIETKPEIPKTSSKRYVYKLKSKSGKVLKYTSNTPIVLKRPIINLTKMAEPEDSGKGDNIAEDVDSDNSTKENMKDNEASGEAVAWTARKRGRPPLSQKTPPTVVNSSDDRRSSDASDVSKTPSSYGVQTRKRQLKFLPDGRLLTPNKRNKTSDGKRSDFETESSSDSDIQTASDDNGNDSDYKNPNAVSKKASMEKKTPVTTPIVPISTEKKPATAKKKVFDIENYLREKIGQSPAKDVRDQGEKSQSATTPSKSISEAITKNKSVAAAVSTNTVQKSPSTPPKKVTPVDPAQLLSSLIGVPITPSQLNIVKFKPKVIQERSSATPTPKKVTIDDEKLRKLTTVGSNEPFKNTPFKVVSKTTFQKILPKPSPLMTPDRTPIMRRLEHRIIPATPTPLTYATIAPKVTSDSVINDSLSKFDNFTDSKVVKTKGGPKKVLKRNSMVDGDDTPRTVYDLLQQVFDQMPSWNLHVIPDTNHFCIAQVSRGRMGIPILKKSIELNGEFFAKVYVHQLHCKRYDGIYDTESKILSLIREIDSLAA